MFVAPDDLKAEMTVLAVKFFAPDLTVLPFPAWDCLPYDRVSPKSDIESTRLSTLAALAQRKENAGPAIVVTTINAILQRVPPRAAIEEASFFAQVGREVDHDKLVAFLAANGYARASTVREPGEFALRGGIIDLWPPGTSDPLRLDFFGTTLDAIRRFDAETQLSSDQLKSIEILPASEAPLDPESISRFRAGYVATFGPATSDPLYESVSAGRKHQGMEHWLPLFHDHLDTLFDYAPDALLFLSYQAEESKNARLELIADYYATRRQFLDHKGEGKENLNAPPYKPLKPERLYLTDAEWKASLSHHRGARAFAVPGAGIQEHGRCGRQAGARFRAGAHGRRHECIRSGGRLCPVIAGGEEARGRRGVDGRLGRTSGRRAVRSRYGRHARGRELAGRAQAA